MIVLELTTPYNLNTYSDDETYNIAAPNKQTMNRYKICIEYDGTCFCGWQRQKNQKISVQETIERALQRLNYDTPVFGAGRTDSGVHATGQIAHFDLPNEVDCAKFQKSINYFMRPERVVILSMNRVTNNFHARFSALKRQYIYRMEYRQAPAILNAKRVWHVRTFPDLDLLQRGASLLVGRHDFNNFRAAGCQAQNSLRTLDILNIESSDNTIEFFIQATSFLHKQVRIMIGALHEIGVNRWPLSYIEEAFAQPNHRLTQVHAPPHGLYLHRVLY